MSQNPRMYMFPCMCVSTYVCMLLIGRVCHVSHTCDYKTSMYSLDFTRMHRFYVYVYTQVAYFGIFQADFSLFDKRRSLALSIYVFLFQRRQLMHMYVCMCVCMYVYMYMHVCFHMYVCVCIKGCMYVYMYMHACFHVCVCMHVCMCACMYVYM
jgi:hypothetical protein